MTTIYFPIAGNGAPTADATCFGNDKAWAFYQLLISDPRQQRPRLVCSPQLVQAAQQRAWGLANGDPWAHVDAAGVTPNAYARRCGCKLPDYYGGGNNIECLTAGMADAEKAYWALTHEGATEHRKAVLGLTDFFREQTHVGIGYAERLGSQYQFYWCVMMGICQE